MNKEELEQKIEELTIKLAEADEFCRNSRDKFQKALLASPDPVCIIDLESFKIIDLNKTFTDLFGYSREEALGKTSVELGIWNDLDSRKRLMNEIKAYDRVKDFEITFNKKNGGTGAAQISAEKIITEGKDCLIAYFRTVTELREKENLYRLLAENSTDVIWVMKPDGRFTYVSPSVEKLRGYTTTEVLNQELGKVMTEESYKKVSILLKTLLESNNGEKPISDSFQTEVEQICKDGSTVWTEVLVTPIWTADKKLKEILGVSRNIQGKKIAQEKALERNKTLENIFRSSPTGMGMVKDRVITFVNDKFCDMTGYRRDEITGKNARFLYENQDEYNRVGTVKYEKIKASGTGGLNTRMVRKDGSVMEVYMSSTPVDIKDWSKGVIFNLLDLSNIREAKNELAINQKKYSSLFDHINDAILVHPWAEDGFTNFIEVNEVACKMYGFTREEFLKLQASDITVAEDIIEHSTDKFRSKIQKDGSMVFETTHIHRDGSRFPVEISSNIVELDNEKIILAVVRDISERKEAEAAIAETENKHREMFKNSPEAMVILDNLGFITDCNLAFSELSGLNQDEVLGKHLTKSGLLPGKKIPQYLKVFNQILSEKNKQKVDFEWYSPNGEIRAGVALLGPIMSGGKVVEIQALIKDTTQQKEFEKNLILAKEKAEENNRLKTAFLETMSHELRTPLNAVIGFSNLIESEKDLSTIIEMNRYISDNGKKLLSIIESIFDISILETKAARIKTESVNLSELFDELGNTVPGLIETEKRTALNIHYQPDRQNENLEIITDKQRLRQLLTNLLTNAVKFTDKGSIRYGFRRIKDTVEFFVSDTGIGIPENKVEMIFEKFRQLEYNPTRSRGGLGLGLAICQEISKLLNGDLRVESSPGEGSTFYFNIPVNHSRKARAGQVGIDLSEKKFLIVEDVESNYLYLEKLLTDSGAEVIWAQTGEEAISIVTGMDSIDMVLMDIRMPDMNGYDITREIKKLRPDLTVIAQTAYAMTSDQKEAIEAGCSAHISKPIRIEDLKVTIGDFIPADHRGKLVI